MVRSVRKPGNRFQFVERAAGMAQRAARNHRHDDARRRGNRSCDQAGLVADAAGRVLIDFDTRNRRQVQRFAGAHHRFGQAR